MPLHDAVHVDAMLSNISIKYRNQAFIADGVMPAVSVKKESDKFWVFGKENFMVPRTLRAPRTRAAEVEWSLSDDTYSCSEYALIGAVEDRERDNADAGLNLDIDTVEYVTDMLLLDREIRVAGVAQATGTFTNAEPDPNWNEASATPIADVMVGKAAMRDAIGLEPNVMVLPKSVLDTLKTCSAITDQVKYTTLGVVTIDLLKALFEVDTILLAGAKYNSAEEGDTEVLTDVWSDTVGLYYVAPRAQPKFVSMGYTFRARKFEVRRWREADRHLDVMEPSILDDEKVTCAGAGYLLTNCNA